MAVPEERSTKLRDASRAARREAVLDEAAHEFNRRGVASARLAELARRLGLSRASLYNYCRDREDLARQCYIRSCELTGQTLSRAALFPGRGIDRIAAFVRLSLEYGRPPIAVLNEISYLPETHQAEVRSARSDNVSALVALIEQGIADGSVRPCRARLACETIFGVLEWATLSRTWAQISDEGFAIRMAAAIPSMILDGVAANDVVLSRPLALEARFDDLIAAFSCDDRWEELARAGSRLFNARGVDGVSLDDIAAEVGATKGLIYHYFDTKRAFVAFCYQRSFRLFERIMTVSDAEPTALEAARTSSTLNVLAQLGELQPLSLGTNYEIFSPDQQREFSEATQALFRRSVARIRRGISDGSIRNMDAEPIALASAGVFNSLGHRLPPSERPESVSTAIEISDFLLYGIRRPFASGHQGYA
ncbi:TetR/AcrR family transcriptional regulator [Phenylobacterium sp.]|uniref:TetR/AcrR family transcriptional regulator n=1 Tax=Phenylobacterium sp. TaxID=1871053 RepID=UPI0025D33D0C|nr:TetR family transcriptional regulator [Phenylobacterium sp.]